MRLVVDELPVYPWDCFFKDDCYYCNCSFTKEQCPLAIGDSCSYLTSFYEEYMKNSKEC